MVTKGSFVLTSKQDKLWRRIIEYCGEDNRLLLGEIVELAEEFYPKHHGQIKHVIQLLQNEGFLLLREDSHLEVTKRKNYRKGSANATKDQGQLPRSKPYRKLSIHDFVQYSHPDENENWR
jgi:hypothetical protein